MKVVTILRPGLMLQVTARRLQVRPAADFEVEIHIARWVADAVRVGNIYSISHGDDKISARRLAPTVIVVDVGTHAVRDAALVCARYKGRPRGKATYVTATLKSIAAAKATTTIGFRARIFSLVKNEVFC